MVHAEVARILTQALGRTIGFTDIPPEALLDGLLGARRAPDHAAFLVQILRCFKAGYAERVIDAIQEITGAALRTIEQDAKDYRSGWVWASRPAGFARRVRPCAGGAARPTAIWLRAGALDEAARRAC